MCTLWPCDSWCKRLQKLDYQLCQHSQASCWASAFKAFWLPSDSCTFHPGTQLLAQQELETHIFPVHRSINWNASNVEALLDFECCVGLVWNLLATGLDDSSTCQRFGLGKLCMSGMVGLCVIDLCMGQNTYWLLFVGECRSRYWRYWHCWGRVRSTQVRICIVCWLKFWREVTLLPT